MSWPIIDWRPVTAPETRYSFLSRIPIPNANALPYIKGFGSVDTRGKLRLHWRPTDTVFYHAKRAIGPPRALPDGATVCKCVRRVYSDGDLLLRLEYAAFAELRHGRPRTREPLSEYVRRFLNQLIGFKDQRGNWVEGRLADAMPAVVGRLEAATSVNGTAEGACELLTPQVHLILSYDSDEQPTRQPPNRSAGSVDWINDRIRIRSGGPFADVVYLFHPKDYFRSSRDPEFEFTRRIRAIHTWLHADLTLLEHLLSSLTQQTSVPELESRISRAAALVEGLTTALDVSSIHKVVTVDLLEKFIDSRVNVIARLHAAASQVPDHLAGRRRLVAALSNLVDFEHRVPTERRGDTAPSNLSLAQMVGELESISPGFSGAYDFQRTIGRALAKVLGNSVELMGFDVRVKEGRSKPDILFRVNNSDGFFQHLDHYRIRHPYLCVECKNGSPSGNDALNQILGYMKTTGSDFGILVGRNIRHRFDMLERQRDLWRDTEKKLVLVMTDEQIIEMLEVSFSEGSDAPERVLHRLFEEIALERSFNGRPASRRRQEIAEGEA